MDVISHNDRNLNIAITVICLSVCLCVLLNHCVRSYMSLVSFQNTGVFIVGVGSDWLGF